MLWIERQPTLHLPSLNSLPSTFLSYTLTMKALLLFLGNQGHFLRVLSLLFPSAIILLLSIWSWRSLLGILYKTPTSLSPISTPNLTPPLFCSVYLCEMILSPIYYSITKAQTITTVTSSFVVTLDLNSLWGNGILPVLAIPVKWWPLLFDKCQAVWLGDSMGIVNHINYEHSFNFHAFEPPRRMLSFKKTILLRLYCLLKGKR